jgi:hypothetical protein
MKRATILLSLLLVTQIAAPAFADMSVKGGAPEGFELLEAPRPTRITLYYGGQVIGSVAAHFSPGKISFDHPAEIIDKLPAVTDKAKVGATLGAPMDAHQDMLCTVKRVDNCGILAPEIAGVIFDEDALTAELFVNRDYLGIVDSNTDRYLPLPEQNFSTVAGFSGAINGSGNGPSSYTLTNSTVMALGEAKLTTQTTGSQAGLRFDTAAASIDRNGWNESGGLFRSHPMELLTDRDMAGVSYSTSMKTRLDDQKTRGNDVILYLPRRSYVSIYREGRLYSSQAYEAGNQRIDTSELPDGAYEITLKIQDSDGTTHEEKRFFAKTQDIPPSDQPTFYFDGGLIRKPAGTDSTAPQITDKPILRAGTVERIAQNAGLNVSVLGVEDRALAETGLIMVEPGMKVSATALTSTRGDLGIQASYLQMLGEDFSTSIDLRKTWMAKSPIPGFEDQSNNTTQASASANYMIDPDVSIGIRASYSEETGYSMVNGSMSGIDQLSTSIGPYTEWKIWSAGDATLGLTIAAAHTDHQNEASSLLHFSYNFGNYNVSGAGGVSYADRTTGPVGNLRLAHTDNTPGDIVTLGGGVSTGNRQQVLSSDADWQNSFGHVRGSLQDSLGHSTSGVGYGGSFDVNATQLDDEIDIGGDQSGKSAVIVDVSGDADTTMKIFVNNVERSAVQMGDHQVVYLAPFHSYDIRIAPAKNALLDYESSNRRVTLYPGNVVKLHWDVNKFYVVSARIVTPDRKPLADAVLQESRAQVTTDRNGRMQAELSTPKRLSFTPQTGAACQVALPQDVKPVNGVLLYTKPLVCQAPLQEAANR